MAGFALIFDAKEHPSLNDSTWAEFHESVAAYKYLERSRQLAIGTNCVAAKLDAPCSLHKGITKENKTGSWLLGVGTVIDPVEINPNGCLDKLLIDYLEQGEGVFSRLEGQYALIIYNGREQSITVVSDAFGMIPVYYAQKDHRFYVSTSALAIAKVIQSTPNEFGVRSFVLYGSTFGDTLWQSVHMLPPATLLKITYQGIQKSIYWAFQVDPMLARLSLNESVDFVIECMSASLRQSLKREGKVWISLTGGMDSRTLAALAQYSGISFKTYCHGPSDSLDVRIAEGISQKMGWEYEYFPLPEDWGAERLSWFNRILGQTDGLLNMLTMSRTIREQTIKAQQSPVSLWGYGGELYRGYYWKQEFWHSGNTTRVDYERLMDYRVIPSDGSILRDGEQWKGSLRAEIKSRFQRIGEQQPDWLNTVKLDLIGQALERHACGITVAAVSGQQRVLLPYDFKDNISRIFSINHNWRTHARMFRLILERLNPRLAEIETADGGPASTMRFKNIHRFIPYWLGTGEKLLWRLGYKASGKALWRKRNAGPAGIAYPIEGWLKDTIVQLQKQDLLVPKKMLSAYLYDDNCIQALFSRPSNAHEGLIGRILAIEFEMCATGMDINQSRQPEVNYAIP
jgi:hypothetical protein